MLRRRGSGSFGPTGFLGLILVVLLVPWLLGVIG